MNHVKLPGTLNVSTGGLTKTNVNVPPAQKFELAAGQIANALGSAVGAAAPFFPAAAVLSAALSGVGNVATTAANSGGGGVGAFGGSPGYMPGGSGMGGMSGMMGGMGSMLGTGGSPYQSMMGGGMGGGSSGGIGGVLGSIMGGVGGMMGGGGMGGTASPGPTGSLSDPMSLLQLQIQMEQQNEMFTTMSNLLNSRHSTAQSLIQNIH